MRGPTAYETYTRRLEDYYKIKHLECPSWIRKAAGYYNFLYYSKEVFGDMCSCTHIPKSTMELLSHIETIISDEIPDELVSGGSETINILKEMYQELISNKELYFIDEWTLSKPGRRKMREFTDRIPSVSGIMPPKTEFTNVPGSISFSNRCFQSEFELTISLNWSCIYVRNGNKDYRETVEIAFNEKFLDRIIPLAQLDNFENIDMEICVDKDRDESVYQSFRTVLVDVNWYYYDLNLITPNEGKLFIDMMKLVWDEYSSILIEKGLVLPWYKTMKWTE